MSDPYADIGAPADPYAGIGVATAAKAPARAAPASVAADFGRKAAKKGFLGALTGAMATVNEAVPGLDELAAGADAAVNLGRDFLTGKQHLDPNDLPGSLKAAEAQAWQAARDRQAGLMTGYREDHPIGSDLATGAGYAVQAVPMLMTGGASAAPEAAAAAGRKTIAQRAAQIATGTAKNAATGAAAAMVNAEAGRGTMTQRGQAAIDAAGPGAVLGVAVPAALDTASYVAGKVGNVGGALARTGVRAVNQIAAKGEGGAFLDPEQQVLSRLSESLRKDGLTPDQITAALNEWQRVGGASPSFMDLVSRNGGGQNTMALIRGAAMSGGGRNEAGQYGARVAADLQDNAIERTRALAPGGQTIPQVGSDVAGRITANSQAPEAAPGSGGAAVHQALNQRYDAARQGVNAAYDAVRASDATVSAPTLADLPGRIRAGLHEALITPEVMGSLNPGTRSVLGEIDRLAGGASRMDAAAQPNAAASLEAGIPTGGQGQSPTFPIAEVERVRQAINARLGTAQGEDRLALQIAKREFDRWLGEAVDGGQIQGDAGGLGLLQTARGQRRDMGQTFESGGLTERLTARNPDVAGRPNLVAPHDASVVIFGRDGVTPRPGLVGDLTRIRDQVGENSPEWNALRQEAQARLLGRDAGTENFGQAWEAFAQRNPQLADLLMTPQERNGLTWQRAGVANAVGDRAALTAGRGVLSTPSDQYEVTMTGVGHRLPIAQTGASGELAGMIERPTEGATGILNRIGSSTRAGRNLAMTYGDQPAADYQASIRNMVDQVNNARFINPNSGSQTAPRLADEQLVSGAEALVRGRGGPVERLLGAILDKFRSGHTLTDEERTILVRMVTRPAEDVSPQILPSMTGGATRLPPRPNVAPVAVGAMSGQRQR